MAALYHGKFPALDFLTSLDETDQAKVKALLDHAANAWPIRNREKFKKVHGPIWEFKTYQTRLFCFTEEKQIVVVTHGTIKKQDRLRKEDIDRAKAIKMEHDAFWDAKSGAYTTKGAK